MFYRIEGLSPGLNGLVVFVEREIEPECAYEVSRIYDTNQIVGDRVVSRPIPEGGLWIGGNFLRACEDPTKRQFATDSPFGKVVVEGKFQQGNLELTYLRYEPTAMSVTIQELLPAGRKTVFSQNFFKKVEQVQSLVNDVIGGRADIDELALHLVSVEED